MPTEVEQVNTNDDRLFTLITAMKESLERKLQDFRTEVRERFERMENAVNQNTQRVMSAQLLAVSMDQASAANSITMSRMDARLRAVEAAIEDLKGRR